MIGGEIPSGVNLLRRAKEKGYGIYGLSNWSAETFPRERPHHSFFDLFDGMIVSGFERMVKPDPRIYQLLLSRYNLKAEECMFIDDTEKNVVAARELGFQSINARDIASLGNL